MDRLVDLWMLLFQENRINRSISWSKYHLYTAFALIMMIAVIVAGYFFSFFYGEWLRIISIAIVIISLFVMFGIPMISGLIKRYHSPAIRSSQQSSVHRQALHHRHPLEKHFITPHRFRIISKTNQVAIKPYFLYQKKKTA